MLERFNQGPPRAVEKLNEIVEWIKSFKIVVGSGLVLKRFNNTYMLDVSPAVRASSAGGSTETGFHIRIGANPVKDGNRCRWKYAWSEVEKATAGWGGWAVKSGGRSGTTTTDPAYNTIEDMAPAGTGTPANGRGLQGNGVNTTTVVGTFNVQPAPSGLVVWVRIVRVVTGESEYHFEYANGYDGACA